jgi:hypothetical protein
MILRLHYERGLPLRKIADLGGERRGGQNNSISTLNRTRQSLVNKLKKQLEAETPLFSGSLGDAARNSQNETPVFSNHYGAKDPETRIKVKQMPH